MADYNSFDLPDSILLWRRFHAQNESLGSYHPASAQNGRLSSEKQIAISKKNRCFFMFV
jgi:hypothetical protein